MNFFEKVLKKTGIIKDAPHTKYLKTSFSQSGEDLIIKYIFDILGIYKPSFIDIGAHHPFYLNNTYLFYVNGSRGVNIEPDSDLFKEFILSRKLDTNLNFGIGAENEDLDFYLMSASTLNTFSKKEAESIEAENLYKIKEIKKIPVKTINNVINLYCNNVFPDLLSLDAEGVDEIIIKSIFTEGFKPKIICIETITYSEIGRGQKQLNLIDYIKSNGYLLYADTNINSIFVLKEIWER